MLRQIQGDGVKIRPLRSSWCLDVTFGEDASLIRLRNAAQNLSFLCRLALSLFRADKPRSISLLRKLKTVAYNPAHVVTALHLGKI